MPEHIAPVTDQLRNTMSSTAEFLAGLDAAIKADNRNKGVVNDAAWFKKTAEQLQSLTYAILGAMASTPLLSSVPIRGARFDIASGTTVARSLNFSVAYLTGEASTNLADGKLDRYKHEATDVAFGYLSGLYGNLNSEILKQCRNDLSTLLESSPLALLIAADDLSRRARSTVVAPSATPEEIAEAGF